ncbi:hypothetical protein J4Q44_G00177410 [Coregonus suidteri]|uniref:Ion transport domain-containing protein n=1 Tax=Coregonus suidteri TaxID=861788 RepID=A0AAN8LGS1_9TELE
MVLRQRQDLSSELLDALFRCAHELATSPTPEGEGSKRPSVERAKRTGEGTGGTSCEADRASLWGQAGDLSSVLWQAVNSGECLSFGRVRRGQLSMKELAQNFENGPMGGNLGRGKDGVVLVKTQNVGRRNPTMFSLTDITDKLEEGIECTNNVTLMEAGAEPCMSTYANWLVVILLVIFLLVTNILLVNLLIAMFSYTFSKVQEHSDTYWKFQRYNLITEYHSRPCLAPPFIILSHLHLFIKRHIRKIPSVKIKHFVLDIRGRQASRLNTWEAIQKENILSAQNKREREKESERLKRTSAKVDSVLKQMAEIRDHGCRLKMLETELEYCSSALSWMVQALSQSNLIKPTCPPPALRADPSDGE